MPITVKHTKVSTIPDADDTSLVRPSDWNADHTLTGLGTMAEQDANNVAITGGSISGVTGVVSSVGIATTSNALAVTNTPITSSGDIGVNFAGLASQYVRGDGVLANFPTNQGGGSSVSYYLNGSVSQGTFGGNTYYQMSKTPIFGTGTNFSISANGYIAQFITNANDPSLLAIPAGAWNCELYFSASAAGGTPNFYLELYKYNGTTFTLISSSSASPEDITGGTSKDLYVTALSVPATTLAVTDRLAIRVYVNHSGRTITLHTEDANLCQIITTFSTGINALNGLTSQVQYFATGTTGSDFNISSVTDTHTFNIPSASALNRGLLTSADWTTFNGKGTVTSIIAGTGLTGGTITTSGTIAIDSTVATLTGTQTLTNKRVTNRIGSNGATTSGNITPTSDTADQYNITGLTGTANIQIPSGTPTDGQRLSIRIKDNGTNRTLTWVTSAGGYRVIGTTLPTTTTANKTIYVGCVYNLADSFWDVVAVASEV